MQTTQSYFVTRYRAVPPLRHPISNIITAAAGRVHEKKRRKNHNGHKPDQCITATAIVELRIVGYNFYAQSKKIIENQVLVHAELVKAVAG